MGGEDLHRPRHIKLPQLRLRRQRPRRLIPAADINPSQEDRVDLDVYAVLFEEWAIAAEFGVGH